MSKKYLLYIHPPEFKLEKHKSKLVNRLLNEYYKNLSKPTDRLNDVYTTKEDEIDYDYQ